VRLIALDLSKSSTGWAAWGVGQNAQPSYGHERLGSEYSSNGMTFCKLHKVLADLHAVHRFDAIFYEQKINPQNLSGVTNIHTINIMAGLEAHTQSFAHAYGIRKCEAVDVGRWRPAFIGRVEHSVAKADARRDRKAGNQKASARDTLKRLTMERAMQLGFSPRCDDEADAIGILTYACEVIIGTPPPWTANEVLRPMMEARA
jgi:hypothetical protein